jgi:hypothetical protein
MRKIALSLAGFALWCAWAGCKPSLPVEPVSIEPPAPASSPPPAPQRPPAAVVGAWQGSPCDSRKYVRNIGFDSDHTFAATDLVSPCPPRAACVWSGIILWRGTWSAQGDRILLTPDAAGRLPDKVPASLVVASGPARLLTEPGDPGCRYSPAP